MGESKEKDLALWKAWRRSGSSSDLQALLQQMDGLLQKEVNRWQGAIAREVLELEAARLAKKAFESYNPKAGTALSTHLINHLQKLSREVYTHQNLARIPEYQTLKINTFQRSHSTLEDQLGRPPTTAELAEHLAWSPAAVETMRKQLRKEEVESVGSGALPAFGRTQSDVMVDLVYHDLSPQQKAIFEHTTGYGGAPVLSGQDLMKKLNITQGQLSYEKKKIISRVKAVGGHG